MVVDYDVAELHWYLILLFCAMNRMIICTYLAKSAGAAIMTKPDFFFSELTHTNQTAITILKTQLHVSAAITDKVPNTIDSA